MTPADKADYQELVDEISELLGAPATLENRDFELIAFGAYDGSASRYAIGVSSSAMCGCWTAIPAPPTGSWTTRWR